MENRTKKTKNKMFLWEILTEQLVLLFCIYIYTSIFSTVSNCYPMIPDLIGSSSNHFCILYKIL